MDPDPIPVRSQPSIGRYSVDVSMRPRSSIDSNSMHQPVIPRPSTSRNPVDPGRHSVDGSIRPRSSIGSNPVHQPVIPRPSTSQNLVDQDPIPVRSRPSTGRHSVDIPMRSRPNSSAIRRHVRDYSHVPVDAIDSDSLDSGDAMLSGESNITIHPLHVCYVTEFLQLKF